VRVVRILFIGDIFGRRGCEAVLDRLPHIVAGRRIDMVIANSEDAADGAGISLRMANTLLENGVDVITTGDNVWRRRDIVPFLSSSDRILRPANYPASDPGRALTVCRRWFGEVAVINLMGQVYMGSGISPFRIVDGLVQEAGSLADTIVVDMHAQATSEKIAMGYYLDGRVTAVIGTHTRVQTADQCILRRGSAYITDVGMAGAIESVLGVSADIVLRQFSTEMPMHIEAAEGTVRIDAVVIECEGRRATAIERLHEIV
jgi:2',3'-cyclic-nucleotide 2'-phosphodiesterase